LDPLIKSQLVYLHPMRGLPSNEVGDALMPARNSYRRIGLDAPLNAAPRLPEGAPGITGGSGNLFRYDSNTRSCAC
jgi:hypothetical protein